MNLTSDQNDAVTELINIGMGKAAASLNDLVNAHVRLTVPNLYFLDMNSVYANLEDMSDGTLATVQLFFKGGMEGSAILVFPPASALNLVAVMTRDESDPTDMDSLRAGTLTEVGNIVINGVIGSIANILKRPMRFSLPRYLEGGVRGIMDKRERKFRDAVLLAKTLFQIERFEVEGNILILFELESFDSLLEALGRLMEGPVEERRAI